MNNDLREQVKQVTAEFYDNGDEKYIMLDEDADKLITLIRTATLAEYQPIHEQKIIEAQAVERQRTLHEVDEVVKGIDDYIHHNGFLFKRSLKERLDNLRSNDDTD